MGLVYSRTRRSRPSGIQPGQGRISQTWHSFRRCGNSAGRRECDFHSRRRGGRGALDHDRDGFGGAYSCGRLLVARREKLTGPEACPTSGWRLGGRAGDTRKVMKKEYDFGRGRRGAVLRVPPGKTRVTTRLDNDVLDWFRQQVDDAGGGNYQTLINVALRGFMRQKQESLETILRRVIREQLRRAG
jgi:uncharacterized protein (DUF4415 family)